MLNCTAVIYLPGQLVLGGVNGSLARSLSDEEAFRMSSAELFPLPQIENCFIPELPQPRRGFSLSVLSGGRIVVCGGFDSPWQQEEQNLVTQPITYDTCLVWKTGSTSWNLFRKLRFHCVENNIIQILVHKR